MDEVTRSISSLDRTADRLPGRARSTLLPVGVVLLAAAIGLLWSRPRWTDESRFSGAAVVAAPSRTETSEARPPPSADDARDAIITEIEAELQQASQAARTPLIATISADTKLSPFRPFSRIRTIEEYAHDLHFNPANTELSESQLARLRHVLNTCRSIQTELVNDLHGRAQSWGLMAIANGQFHDNDDPRYTIANSIRVGLIEGMEYKKTTIQAGDNPELDFLANSIHEYVSRVEVSIRRAFLS
jgi:hypothetical protein